MPQTTSRRNSRMAPAPKRTSPLKRLGITLYILLVVVSAIIVGVYAAFHFLVPEPAIPDPVPPSDQSVIAGDQSTPPSGSQSQEDETGRTRRKGAYTFALLGSDKGSGNTDTIILVTFDTQENTVGMVSIPRDTAVHRTWAKYPKINAAYSRGVDTLRAEIQDTFGIPIDYYVRVDLNAFIALVDELEGVTVDIPEDMNYDDPYQDLHIHFTKGRHHLDGQGAMEVVRFRHNNEADGGGGYNDEGRSAMQQQVLVALAEKMLSWNSLTKIKDFLDIFQTYVKTNLSASDMAWFAAQAIQVDLSTGLKQGVLEGRGDGVFKGHSWCYIYEEETILPILNEYLNPYDQPLTEEDLNLPNASKYIFNY